VRLKLNLALERVIGDFFDGSPAKLLSYVALARQADAATMMDSKSSRCAPLEAKSMWTGCQRSLCPLASPQSPRFPRTPMVASSLPSGLGFLMVAPSVSQIQTLSSASSRFDERWHIAICWRRARFSRNQRPSAGNGWIRGNHSLQHGLARYPFPTNRECGPIYWIVATSQVREWPVEPCDGASLARKHRRV